MKEYVVSLKVDKVWRKGIKMLNKDPNNKYLREIVMELATLLDNLDNRKE